MLKFKVKISNPDTWVEVMKEIVEEFVVPKAPIEERIKALAESEIIRRWARTMCEWMEMPTEECIKRMAYEMARRVFE